MYIGLSSVFAVLLIIRIVKSSVHYIRESSHIYIYEGSHFSVYTHKIRYQCKLCCFWRQLIMMVRKTFCRKPLSFIRTDSCFRCEIQSMSGSQEISTSSFNLPVDTPWLTCIKHIDTSAWLPYTSCTLTHPHQAHWHKCASTLTYLLVLADVL